MLACLNYPTMRRDVHAARLKSAAEAHARAHAVQRDTVAIALERSASEHRRAMQEMETALAKEKDEKALLVDIARVRASEAVSAAKVSDARIDALKARIAATERAHAGIIAARTRQGDCPQNEQDALLDRAGSALLAVVDARGVRLGAHHARASELAAAAATMEEIAEANRNLESSAFAMACEVAAMQRARAADVAEHAAQLQRSRDEGARATRRTEASASELARALQELRRERADAARAHAASAAELGVEVRSLRSEHAEAHRRAERHARSAAEAEERLARSSTLAADLVAQTAATVEHQTDASQLAASVTALGKANATLRRQLIDATELASQWERAAADAEDRRAQSTRIAEDLYAQNTLQQAHLAKCHAFIQRAKEEQSS